jgi:hypothetical protein
MKYLLILLLLTGCFAEPKKHGRDCIDTENYKYIGLVTNVEYVAPAEGAYVHISAKTIVTIGGKVVVLTYVRPIAKGTEAYLTKDCLGDFWFTGREKGSIKVMWYQVYDKSFSMETK